MFGFGFYLLHGCIQVHVTDLSPTRARRGHLRAFELLLHGAGDRSGRSTAYGYAHGSLEPLMFLGAAVVMVVAIVCSRFLRLRNAAAAAAAASADLTADL